jgi:membrane-associated protease RseP (regulator of RpoE activity)
MRVIAINGTNFDYAAGKTPERYLYDLKSPGEVNLTQSSGENVSIYVDYLPLVYGAFEFRSFFTGAFFESSENSVEVTRVLKNATETGINEGILNRGDIITSVNGYNIHLPNGTTFEEFLLNSSGVNLDITEPELVVFGIQTDTGTYFQQVIFMPIPKSYVFIGVQSSPYWVPKNGFTRLLGGNFPIWLEREIFYFYMVAFSVTLFNMLPLPIFDGNRILQEIVHWIVGTKYGKKAKKKIKLYFDPEESDYALMEYNVTKIIDMEMDLSTHIHPER